MYLCNYIHIHIHPSIHICIFVCISLACFTYIYTPVDFFTYVQIFISTRLSVYVYIHTYTSVYTYIHIHIYISYGLGVILGSLPSATPPGVSLSSRAPRLNRARLGVPRGSPRIFPWGPEGFFKEMP